VIASVIAPVIVPVIAPVVAPMITQSRLISNTPFHFSLFSSIASTVSYNHLFQPSLPIQSLPTISSNHLSTISAGHDHGLAKRLERHLRRQSTHDVGDDAGRG
jgi:hypothetical protein